MGERNIIKTNELIAKFMGGEYRTDLQFTFTKDGWINTLANDSRQIAQSHEFKYHCSWDWLMTVIEKIEMLEVKGIESTPIDDHSDVTYQFDVVVAGFQCTINRDMIPQYSGTERDFLNLYDCRNKSKIKSTYKAVIAFIKWYNKQLV